MAKEIAGGFLILDTNIIMSLFGLNGEERREATQRVIDLSRGLNFRPMITPQTITEYKTKIRSLMHNSRYWPRMTRQEAMKGPHNQWS